jgi:hypothetical protein
MTMSNRLTSSTDFSRFFHDYINTPIASTDFTRFFHDYIKHTHRLDWLPQVFPWLCQTRTSSTDVNRFFPWKNLLKSVEAMDVFDSHGKTFWSQLKRCVLDIVMEKPVDVRRRGACLT